MKIIELESVDSTNEYIKRLGLGGDVIVVAKRQTGGKGTKGRSFASDEGGLYLSIARTYNNFDPAKTFTLMINACVAVCKTLEEFGLKPTVKWANDVLLGGKKICGTLIENTHLSAHICHSIVGIGINVNNILPSELNDIATTMRAQLAKKTDIGKVKTALIKNLQNSYNVNDYKRYVDWFGRKIMLDMNGEKTEAIALDIAEDGRLICKIDNNIRQISSAEVSLRLN
ncbi:MAG: biotin--[acetyl-CoA-carboxylase] ligase [Clostridia bacterium]|nr:biotin--[acetyl-CoA-carboxylase] ligase [Clostridia bacterium]